MPATHLLTTDGRKIKLADAHKNPHWFGDLDEEMIQWLVESASKDQYANVTVTQLIAPIKQTTLAQRHNFARRPEDILEAAIGRRFHGSMEAASRNQVKSKTGPIVEQPMFVKIDGVTVGGTPDKLYRNKRERCDVLTSRKVRRVYWWRWLQKGVNVLEDEHLQESCYAYLARHGKYVVGKKKVGRNPQKAFVQYLLRDWVKREWEDAQEKGKEYPPPFGSVQVPLMDDDSAKEYITERVKLWKMCRKRKDLELPQCNEAERWKDNMRCRYFCDVKEFCVQWHGEADVGF